MKKLILLLMLIMAMPVQAEWVTAESGLRVREHPTTSSKTVEIVPYGTEIAVVDDEPIKGWARVKNGYMSREWLSKDNPQDGMELLGTWKITAYAWTGYTCANGNYPSEGYTVACNSLPFGARVYIEGVGFRTVEDTDGGAMGNEWLDLYLGDYNSCVQWGMQYRKVWRVKDEK